VQSDRCPRCAAAVPALAEWCGLCFADLRPVPAVPAAAPVPTGYDPLTAPLVTVEAGLQSGPYAPSYDQSSYAPPAPYAPSCDQPYAPPAPDDQPRHAAPPPGPLAPPAPAAATWPCMRCGEANPVEADACLRCGSGFLAGAEAGDLALPGIGRPRGMDRTQKATLVLAGTAVLVLFFVGLSMIFGALI